MNSYDSIRAFDARVQKLYRLDGVLENAGIMSKYFKIVAGYEAVITTNVISTFLLALLLLPKLRETKERFGTRPVLSIVASDLHFIAKFPERDADDIFAALNNQKSELGVERYGTLKLNVFASFQHD